MPPQCHPVPTLKPISQQSPPLPSWMPPDLSCIAKNRIRVRELLLKLYVSLNVIVYPNHAKKRLFISFSHKGRIESSYWLLWIISLLHCQWKRWQSCRHTFFFPAEVQVFKDKQVPFLSIKSCLGFRDGKCSSYATWVSAWSNSRFMGDNPGDVCFWQSCTANLYLTDKGVFLGAEKHFGRNLTLEGAYPQQM